MQIGSDKTERQSEFMVFLDEFRLFDCPWKCLTECPIPGQDCYWDDPGYPILDEVPELETWRELHKKLVRKEPKDPMRNRCPRCLSTKVIIGYPHIECRNCGYNEPLIDFPISQYFHLALLQEVKGGRSKKGTPKMAAPFILAKKKKRGQRKGTLFTSGYYHEEMLLEACVKTDKVL